MTTQERLRVIPVAGLALALSTKPAAGQDASQIAAARAWGEEVCLSAARRPGNQSLENWGPRVVAQGDHVMVFWQCGTGDPRYAFPLEGRGPWLAKAESHDGGHTWSGPRWVTPFLIGPFDIQWIEETAHLVFHTSLDPTTTNTPREVFYSRSDDDGENWSEPVRLSFAKYDPNPRPPKHTCINPQVYVDDQDTVHVAWVYHEDAGASTPQCRRSKDGGTSWGTTQAIGDLGGGTDFALWGSGNTILMAFPHHFKTGRGGWTAPGGVTIPPETAVGVAIALSDDRGESWTLTGPVQVLDSDGNPQKIFWEQAEIVGDTCYLTTTAPWARIWERNKLLWLSVDVQGKVSAAHVLTAPIVVEHAPLAITSSGRELHFLVTEVQAPGSPLTHMVSVDGGDTWSEPLRISAEGETVVEADAYTCGSGTHIVWRDKGRWNLFGDLLGAEGRICYRRLAPRLETDAIAPAGITDLVAEEHNGVVTVRWTSPGDDGTVGAASRYMVRYNQIPINEANWQGAFDVANPPSPAAAGTQQQMEVRGLRPGATYYFAVVSEDEAGNVSPVSNSAAINAR